MSADRTIQLRLTPVRLVVVAIAVIALVWCLVLVVIQHLPPALDTKWPKPVKMENVNFLYCWNGTAVCMGGGGVLRFLNDEGQWIEKTVPGFGTEKNEYCYPVAVDADGPTAIFCDVKYTNKVEAIRSFITGTMVPGEELRFGPRIPLHDYVQDLSRGTGAGSGFRREIDLVCGQGTVRGSELYTPYVAESTEIIERITSAGTHQQERRSGPDVCGVFHSTDAGRSWQSTRVGAFRESYSATIRATRSHLHLLRTEYSRNLWFSTQMPDSSTWSEPKLLIGIERCCVPV